MRGRRRRSPSQQSGRGGSEERGAGAVDRLEAQQRPERRVAGDHQQGKHPLAREACNVGGDHQTTPRQAIGEHPAEQHEQDQGHEARGLDEPHVGQRSRRTKYREGHRQRHHAVAQHRHGMPDEIPAEIAMAPSACAMARNARASTICTRPQDPAHSRAHMTTVHAPCPRGVRLAGSPNVPSARERRSSQRHVRQLVASQRVPFEIGGAEPGYHAGRPADALRPLCGVTRT
jgi:hypothetical protein